MFIAHLPAAYLASRPILGRLRLEGDRRLLAWGLAAGVLPDLDLLWFYLVDQRRQVHHAYLPHLPAAWLALFGSWALVMFAVRARRRAWAALVLVAVNVGLHLVLDTVAGGIRWLWPLSQHEFVLVEVAPRYQPWYLNFLLHWSVLVELVLVGTALWSWRRDSARVRSHAPSNIHH